uniref:Uncharacterized protein n=1 Tax=Nelumbo nucifera TaxID=4432 RepID=A0A822ZK26_NELNU|nr:TPA_asm: hypothetical protein HUJ06_002181 [Nelumbo nucifera]
MSDKQFHKTFIIQGVVFENLTNPQIDLIQKLTSSKTDQQLERENLNNPTKGQIT